MEDAKTTVVVKAAEPSESADGIERTKFGKDIGEAGVSQPVDSTEQRNDQEKAGSVMPAGAEKTLKFPFKLKITPQAGLIAATLLLGLVTLLIFGRATGRSKATRELREQQTVESLTPEGLVSRCGEPAGDVTNDLYPMIKRTMSYESSGKGTLVLEFSRTAEEKSDWVFLSMSDGNGTSYGTSETQIAAMPCLRSGK